MDARKALTKIQETLQEKIRINAESFETNGNIIALSTKQIALKEIARLINDIIKDKDEDDNQ